MFAIRRARPADASALAELASRTFTDAFAAQNRPEDVELYLARSFGEPQQRAEIENPDGVTLVVEVSGALIAFAQLRRSDAGHGEVELARFYVERTHHGRGVAQAMMDAVLDAARSLGAGTLWLGVWEHNPRGIRFYEKCGFRDVGSHPFLVGNDLQTDRIMTFVIPPR